MNDKQLLVKSYLMSEPTRQSSAQRLIKIWRSTGKQHSYINSGALYSKAKQEYEKMSQNELDQIRLEVEAEARQRNTSGNQSW